MKHSSTYDSSEAFLRICTSASSNSRLKLVNESYTLRVSTSFKRGSCENIKPSLVWWFHSFLGHQSYIRVALESHLVQWVEMMFAGNTNTKSVGVITLRPFSLPFIIQYNRAGQKASQCYVFPFIPFLLSDSFCVICARCCYHSFRLLFYYVNS